MFKELVKGQWGDESAQSSVRKICIPINIMHGFEGERTFKLVLKDNRFYGSKSERK